MKIQLVKTNMGTLIPAFDSDNDKFKKMTVGDIMEMSWKKPRNPGFHRKYFALIKLVYENTERFPNQNACRLWLQIKAGHVDFINDPNDSMVAVPKSISFDSMDDAEFESIFNSVVDVAINDLDFPTGMIDELANFY